MVGKYTVIILVTVLLIVFAGPARAADLFRPLPHYFYGEVTVAGGAESIPAPPGTTVSVRAKGEERVLGVYTLGRSGTFGSVKAVGRCLAVGHESLKNGDVLVFYVNGIKTGTEMVFRRGAVTRVNLQAADDQPPGVTLVEEGIRELAGQKIFRFNIDDNLAGVDEKTLAVQADAPVKIAYVGNILQVRMKQNKADGQLAVTVADRAGRGHTYTWAIDPVKSAVFVERGQPEPVTVEKTGPKEEEKEVSKAAVTSEKITFADIQGHPLQEEIEAAAAKGLVKGVTATEFAPDRPVTRAEFTVMLVEALGIEGKETKLTFLDVFSTDWFYPAVKRAFSAGVISGYSSVEFKPHDPISREQAAAVAASALLYKKRPLATDQKVLKRFADFRTISPWARPGMATSVDLGLLRPRGNKLAPGRELTRAEAAAMLVKLQ